MEMGLALGSKKKEGLWIDDGEALVGEVAVAHLPEAAPVGAPVLEPPRQLQHPGSLAMRRLVGAPKHSKYAAHP